MIIKYIELDDSISEAGVSLCDASVGCEEVKGVRVFGGLGN